MTPETANLIRAAKVLADLGYAYLSAEVRDAADLFDAANEHRQKAEDARARAALYAQATRWLRMRVRYLERGERGERGERAAQARAIMYVAAVMRGHLSTRLAGIARLVADGDMRVP